MEERDLLLRSSKLLDLFFSIESVGHIEGISNLAVNRHEFADALDKSLHRALGHVLKSILHHKLGLLEELFELSHFVSFL